MALWSGGPGIIKRGKSKRVVAIKYARPIKKGVSRGKERGGFLGRRRRVLPLLGGKGEEKRSSRRGTHDGGGGQTGGVKASRRSATGKDRTRHHAGGDDDRGKKERNVPRACRTRLWESTGRTNRPLDREKGTRAR